MAASQVKKKGPNAVGILLTVAVYVLAIGIDAYAGTLTEQHEDDKATETAIAGSPSDKATAGPRPISLEALERLLDDLDLDPSPGFQPTPSSPDR